MLETAPARLAATFAELAHHLHLAQGVDHALQRIADVAVELIEGCDHASISWAAMDDTSTRVSTSSVADLLDGLQYACGNGPCLEVVREHPICRLDDLTIEQRWPEFARQASAQTDVRSMLCFRLTVQEDVVGGLHLYSAEPAAFSAANEPVLAALAALAAVAISNARQTERISQLSDALTSNREIGKAIGILMASRQVDADEAFDLLRSASSRLNVKLRDVASRVVEGQERDAALGRTSNSARPAPPDHDGSRRSQPS